MKTVFQNFFYIRPIYCRTNIHDRDKFILTAALFKIYFKIYSWETTKALFFFCAEGIFLTTNCHEKEKNFFFSTIE